MKRLIKAAEDTKENEFFQDAMNKAKDDFEYLLDGLDKLSRDGKDRDEAVVQIVMDLNKQLADATGGECAVQIIDEIFCELD